MIAFLSGRLLFKSPQAVTVLAGGVGYQVFIPLSVFYILPEAGDTVEFHVYTHVREDTLQLFGFQDPRERDMFLRLIEVSGIGPKLAVTILSGMPYKELGEALMLQDVQRIQTVPGIGKKTAERMVLELKEKISRMDWAVLPGREMPFTGRDQLLEDALSALVNLGYPKPLAEKALREIQSDLPENPTLEDLLKETLKKFSGRKL